MELSPSHQFRRISELPREALAGRKSGEEWEENQLNRLLTEVGKKGVIGTLRIGVH